MPLPFMSRSDKKAWASAQTFADLGRLMAAWLEGHLGSRPGYAARYGPDDETTPLIPVLAAACRGGYITDNSQSGFHDHGDSWRQRAAVDGWILDRALYDRVTRTASRAGLHVITTPPGRKNRRDHVIVTERHGEPMTGFGPTPDPRNWDGIGRAAYQEIKGAHWVVLIDPQWGPSTRLWDLLRQAL